jgi:large subunit ribosomal protein L29
VKAKEVRDLTPDELRAKAQELRTELFNAKVRHATGQLEDTAKLSRLRRDLARTETVIRSRREAQQ